MMPPTNDACMSASDVAPDTVPPPIEVHAAEDAALHHAARGAEASRTASGRTSMRRYDAEAVDYASGKQDQDPSKSSDAESRPRTAVLSSAGVEEMGAGEANLNPDSLQYSYPPAQSEQASCRSAPSSPTTFPPSCTTSVIPGDLGRNPKAQSQNTSSGLASPTPRMFRHRGSNASFPLSGSLADLASESSLPPFALRPILGKPIRQRQRANSVPPNVALSPRSQFQDKKRACEPSSDEPAAKKRRPEPSDAPSEQKVVRPHAAPLSQHQLYALHQLNLPRPAFLTDSFSASRSWNLRKSSSKSLSSIYGNAEIHVPTMTPPITRHTLRELDLSEILRNPQLRHDIVFDASLCFRPNLDGERGARKMLGNDRYWVAITREVSCGCRCTAFEGHSVDHLPCVCSAVGFSRNAIDTLVGRPLPLTGKAIFNAVPLATRLPSRFPPLVEELRSVLLSLLPASANAGLDDANSADDRASRRVIHSTLDPDLIAQEAEHGVLDVASLGRFLGQTLKLHCAPMRDEMVNQMVSAIESKEADGNQVAKGLRMAFEILELMKLDIANHQLRTLRPYLLETAVEFELRSYLECADRRKVRATEKTLAWVGDSAARTGSKDTSLLVRDGLLQLLFHPESIAAASPPRSRSKRPRHALLPSSSCIPETLQLDTHRLQTLHSDLTDLQIVYMLLMLFSQMVAPLRVTEDQLDVVRREIWIIMHSNGIARSTSGLSPVAPSPIDQEASTPCASPMSCAGVKKLQDDRFKDSLQDVVLRIAVRVKMLQSGQSFTEEAPCYVVPDEATVGLMARWLDKHLKVGDPLFALLQDRLRTTIDAMLASFMSQHASASKSWWVQSSAVEDTLFDRLGDPCSTLASRHFDPTCFDLGGLRKRPRENDAGDPPCKRMKMSLALEVDHEALIQGLLQRNGLAILRHECDVVVERLGRVATFHLDAYKSLYTCMLQTAF